MYTKIFNHILGQTRDKALMRDLARRVNFIRWVTDEIIEQGPDPEWITTSSEPIIKASLSFISKFW